MSADFETDTGADGVMYPVQLGVGSCFDGKLFSYKETVSEFTESIFNMACCIAFHKVDNELYDSIDYKEDLVGMETKYWGKYEMIFKEKLAEAEEELKSLIEDIKKAHFSSSEEQVSFFQQQIAIVGNEIKDLNYKINNETVFCKMLEIPLFFHNGIKFDNALLLEKTVLFDEWKVDNNGVIGSSATNFKQFTFSNDKFKVSIKIVDFMSFKQGSLEKIVESCVFRI